MVGGASPPPRALHGVFDSSWSPLNRTHIKRVKAAAAAAAAAGATRRCSDYQGNSHSQVAACLYWCACVYAFFNTLHFVSMSSSCSSSYFFVNFKRIHGDIAQLHPPNCAVFVCLYACGGGRSHQSVSSLQPQFSYSNRLRRLMNIHTL